MIVNILYLLNQYFCKLKHTKTTFYKNVIIDKESIFEDYTVLFKNVKIINSKIGKYTYIQENSNVFYSIIGPFCSIASNVTIGLIDHPTSYISTSPIFYDNTQPLPKFFIVNSKYIKTPKITNIGADVWIGENVKIKEGINIGNGSIIGAGSIVTKDVLPYSIVVGIPSKHIKFRFNEDLILKLNNSKWWEADEEIINKLESNFNNPDICLKNFHELKNYK